VEHCYVNDRGLEISSRFAIERGKARKMTTLRRLGDEITVGTEGGGGSEPLRRADMRTACNLQQHKKVKEVAQ
jgi:N-methylhydantoinase B/oxoprolinase/acetone carboxylase alpha subunit